MGNNDIHFIRKELDRLQTKVSNFDVKTEYAQSNSDTTAPTTGWKSTKPAPVEGKFIWARNIMDMGYGDVITEPFCIGDGLEHILSIDVEYIAWSDAYQSPPQTSEYWQTTAPSIQSGQYIWTRTKTVTTFGTNYTDPLRVTGVEGANGQNGVSIKGDDGKGFDFIYRTTNDDSYNTRPADDVTRTQNQYDMWCDSPTPVDASHPYVYMSLRTTDSNGDWGHWSVPVLMSSIGEKGEDGEGFEIVFTRTNSDSTVPNFLNSNNQNTGIYSYSGTDSQGREYKDADYLPKCNGSNTEWTDNQQGVDSDHKYEWASFRFKTVTNGNASWGNFNTPKIWATYSEDGTSSYIHIRYAEVNNPANSNQVYTIPKRYIGIYIDTTQETQSNKTTYDNPNLYSWSLFKPEEGIDYDGKFLHMKYATDVTFNNDGSVNTVTFTGNNGEDAGTWLGTLFDYTLADSTNGRDYTWTKIEGRGISGVQEQYALHTDYTTAPTSGWSNSPLENEVGKFYWTRSVVSFTDGTSTTTDPICVSGVDGDGVKNIFYCYDSLTTPTQPTNSTQVSQNSSTASQNYDKWVEDPVSISEDNPYIYISTSTSYSFENGNKVWTDFSEPALWSRYASDGSAGSQGTAGIGYEYAYKTTDTEIQPSDKPSGDVSPTSGYDWAKVPVPMTSTYKYMYISYRTIQGSTKSPWKNSALWSQFGEKGDDGARGVDGKGLEHIFYLTNEEVDWDSITSSSQNSLQNPVNWTASSYPDRNNTVTKYPADNDFFLKDQGWSDDATGVDDTNMYEYCSIRTKEPNSQGIAQWGAFSTPSLWAKYGEKGDKGDDGNAGQGFEYAYKTVTAEGTQTAPTGTVENPSTRGQWATKPLAMDTTYKFTYISYRTSDENGNWGSWSTPALWSRYSEDGIDGKGITEFTGTIGRNTNPCNGVVYPHRVLKTDLHNNTGKSEFKIGEYIKNGTDLYLIECTTKNTDYYHLTKTELKGATGEKGADGVGLEHIFCRTDADGYIVTDEGSRLKRSGADILLSASTNSNPANWSANPNDDHYDTSWGWYDDAHGVTASCPREYVAIRTKSIGNDGKTAEWGTFTPYRLWATYSKDGASIQFAYYTTANANYTGYPTGTLAIGNSKAENIWCETPYATSEDYPYLYVSTKATNSNIWSQASLMSSYGLTGASGVNGTGYEYAFYTSASSPTDPPQESNNEPLTTGVVGSWQKTPVAMTDSATKIYISYRTKVEGETPSSWSTPALWSIKGKDGQSITDVVNYYATTRAYDLGTSENHNDLITPTAGFTRGASYTTVNRTAQTYTGKIPINNGMAFGIEIVEATSGQIQIGRYEGNTSTYHQINLAVGKYKIECLPNSIIFKRNGTTISTINNPPRTETAFFLLPVNGSLNVKYKNFMIYSSNMAWHTDISQVVFDNTYCDLWNYEESKSGDTVISSTDPCLIGHYAEDGVAGRGITSITEEYALTQDTSPQPQEADWNTSIPVMTSTNKYLWNRETINFTSGSPTVTTPKIIGAYGDKGQKGYDGVGFEMIFYLTNTEHPTWTTSNDPSRLSDSVINSSAYQKAEYIPFQPNSPWKDDPSGVSSQNKYEFASIRTSDKNGVWSPFSTPSLFSKFGDDGASIEYIYKLTNSTTSPTFEGTAPQSQQLASFTGTVTRNNVAYHFQDADFVPTGWSDDPLSVTENNKYCWVSQRTKSANGEWGNFSPPSVWAKWGEKGADGEDGIDGSGTEYIYYRTNTQKSASQWLSPRYVDYGITGSSNANYGTWNSSYEVTANGTQLKGGSITNDYSYLNLENSRRYTLPFTIEFDVVSPCSSAGITFWDTTNHIVSIPYAGHYAINVTQNKIYATCNDVEINTPSVSFSQNPFVGFVAFAQNCLIFKNVVVYDSDNANPRIWEMQQTDEYIKSNTGWTDDPSGVTEANQYEYVSKRTKTPNAQGVAKWGRFSVPSLWAKYGEQGEQGERGSKIIEISIAPAVRIDSPYYWSENSTTYYYRKEVSAVLSEGDVTEVKVGDYLKYDTTIYLVDYNNGYWVYLIETELSPDMENIDASYLDGKEASEFMTANPLFTEIEQNGTGLAGSVECRKLGSLIIVNVIACTVYNLGGASASPQNSGWEKIKETNNSYITIPSQYRPSSTIMTSGASTMPHTRDINVYINSDGNIAMKRSGFANTSTSTSDTIYATFVYFVDTRTDTSLSNVTTYQSGFCSGDYLEVQLTRTSNSANLSGKNVIFVINNRAYSRTTDSNGKASLKVTLSAGSYTWSAKFNGDGTYKPVTISQTTYVYSCKRESGANIVLTNSSTIQKNKPFIGTVTNSHGEVVKNITVTLTLTDGGNVDHTYYAKTDDNGQFAMYHPNDGMIYDGTEQASCVFETDKNYVDITKSFYITCIGG